MDLFAWMGVVFFLLLIVLLVKKNRREAIQASVSSGDARLFLLSGLIILYNVMLATEQRRFGTGQWMAFVYFMGATIIVFAFPSNPEGRAVALLGDFILICWLWIPNDFGLNYMFQSWGGGALGYALTAFTGMVFVLIVYTGWRRAPFNLSWKFAKKDLAWIFGAYLILAALIIPLAIKVGFIHLGLIKSPGKALLSLFIWFAPALCEELIFRGVIQRVLIGWFRPVAGIILASLIFGLSHIDNKAGDYSYPNWWYVFLAGIAGSFYGIVAYKRNLQSSATLHFLVDFTWVLFFRGGK